MLSKESIYKDFIQEISEKNVLIDEPMSKHTSFKTGGNADIFVKLETEEKLKYILQYAKKNKIPVTIIGNGTNLLVRDGGIRGIVIQLKINNVEVTDLENKIIIKSGAGVSLARLANIAKDNCGAGLEFAIGIPGTLGGAIKMNAGAYGAEMQNVIKTTKYIDLDGNVKNIQNSEHQFEYRNSIFSKTSGIILESVIELTKGNQEEIEKKMKENMKARGEKQPIDKPSAGSTFKRGNGYITAKLIDECGLKGYKIGGAKVSTKHAGFVINARNATSKDILSLIEYIQEKVYEKYKIEIEPEVQIVGED